MRSVLVVEDDYDLAKAELHALTGAGYRVFHACDGVEALATLAAMDPLPAVILLDLAMPRMDGWQLISALEADGRLARIPVIVVSAYTSHRTVGSHPVLTVSKPYSMRTLLASVRTFAGAPEEAEDTPRAPVSFPSPATPDADYRGVPATTR